MYILAYRNLGIFYENAVNRILRDFVKASKPIQAVVTGEFNVRGGMKSQVPKHRSLLPLLKRSSSRRRR